MTVPHWLSADSIIKKFVSMPYNFMNIQPEIVTQ